jgi:hypothetical protein
MSYLYDHLGPIPRLVLTGPGEAQLCVPIPHDVYLACVDLAHDMPQTLRAIVVQALREARLSPPTDEGGPS